MSFWKDIGNFFTGSRDAEEALLDYQNKSGAARAEAKQRQLGFIDSWKAPQMTSQMSARLKALEDESRAGPLVQDPYFQANRDQLVRGGQAALSRVEQNQKAANVRGGFANTGSIQDVYDRLGSGLAQLGQQSTQLKAEKADRAAQARQQFQDSLVAFENAKIQAQAAIEAGDAAAAQQALSQAYAAKEQIRQAETGFWRNAILTGIGTGLGAAAGNPLMGASIANSLGGGGGGGNLMTLAALQGMQAAPQLQANYGAPSASISPVQSGYTNSMMNSYGLPYAYLRGGN